MNTESQPTTTNIYEMIGSLGEDEFPKILHDSENQRTILFVFKAGKDLQPHTSKSEVLMCVIKGEGTFLLQDERIQVSSGSLVVCPGDMSHGISAKTDMIVLAVITPGV